MIDRVGQEWGNYRLLELLGRGGFAEVYLGQHIRLMSQRAALKILSTHLSERDIQRFQFEAETIVSLSHPHIVRVFDFALNEGIPYLVMDYAPGRSLRQRHPRGERLELSRVISYVQQVTEGLQYAHDRRIIHRDIKPDNMLIGVRDEILLSDFGVATIAHGTSSQSAQLVIGSVPYMAPEQIQEHPRPASDQYALTTAAYEWLSGNPPFTGTFTEVAIKHILVPPPPLRDWVPNLPPEVEQVIFIALAKDPKARFGSVHAFAQALTEASRGGLSGANVAVHPAQTPPPSQILPKLPPQVREAMIAPAQEQAQTPATPAPATPGEGWEMRRPITPLPDTTREEWDKLGPITPLPATPAKFEAADPAVESHAMRGDGPQQRPFSRRVVVTGLVALGVAAAGGSVFGWNVMHSQRSLSSPTPQPHVPIGTHLLTYNGHSGAVRSIAWSPNGKRIASGGEDSTVQVWDASTGTKAITYKGQSASVLSANWSPDGKRIASGARDRTAQVWDAGTGALVFKYRGHTDDVHAVAWSPDGRRIASGSDDTTVQVWDAGTGVLAFEYRGHTRPVESLQWSPDGKRIASASDDYTVRILDAGTGALLFTYLGHTDWVLSAAWSPEGKRIASTSRDMTVQMWDAGTGALVFKYQGDTNWVEKIQWSPDGKRIASASDDHTVRILDAGTGALLFTYPGHSEMYAVAWSPEGKRIASGGNDRVVQLWRAV